MMFCLNCYTAHSIASVDYCCSKCKRAFVAEDARRFSSVRFLPRDGLYGMFWRLPLVAIGVAMAVAFFKQWCASGH